ncbi:YSIRK-type signal peptide-containing protein, partial [Streptococcus oralis]|uniref:YSIRK-type signal peptide-containing protein n=2 Tax=Streptococcus oralis TaxID=1303 RepID=UPI0034A49856
MDWKKHEKYSIRKLSIGVASILVGQFFVNHVQEVKADEATAALVDEQATEAVTSSTVANAGTNVENTGRTSPSAVNSSEKEDSTTPPTVETAAPTTTTSENPAPTKQVSPEPKTTSDSQSVTGKTIVSKSEASATMLEKTPTTTNKSENSSSTKKTDMTSIPSSSVEKSESVTQINAISEKPLMEMRHKNDKERLREPISSAVDKSDHATYPDGSAVTWKTSEDPTKAIRNFSDNPELQKVFKKITFTPTGAKITLADGASYKQNIRAANVEWGENENSYFKESFDGFVTKDFTPSGQYPGWAQLGTGSIFKMSGLEYEKTLPSGELVFRYKKNEFVRIEDRTVRNIKDKEYKIGSRTQMAASLSTEGSYAYTPTRPISSVVDKSDHATYPDGSAVTWKTSEDPTK